MWSLHERIFVSVVLGLLSAVVGDARAATISGEVTTVPSDGGYQPSVFGTRVRIVGTDISAPVVAADRYSGTFTLTDVPPGSVTLVFEEYARGDLRDDTFTQLSKRVTVDVEGDVEGVEFQLVPHWRFLHGYPPPWRETGYTSEWTPFFLDADTGWIIFRVRGPGIDPERIELWGTTTGGAAWGMNGRWLLETVPEVPDRSFALHFGDADHGVVAAQIDVNAHPDVYWYLTAGFLRTADGGATWTFVDLPNPPEPTASGVVTIQRIAGIDERRWIAAGANAGTSSSGQPGYVAIWETEDAGETWNLAAWWQEDYGTVTGLGADATGRAILFATPYRWGGGLRRMLRESSGTWSVVEGNHLIVNSGYGPGDVPMLGDRAWIQAEDIVDGPTGVWTTWDAGLTWEPITTALPQYMDFGSTEKAFATAGGPSYVSYDGGRTWRFQAQGGGLCCHGNDVFAFDETHAIWHDAGVGDPNGLPDVFTYDEPPFHEFEVLGGVNVPDAMVDAGSVDVPAASCILVSHGPGLLELESLGLAAQGNGDDASEVRAVNIWIDADADGVRGADDRWIGAGRFADDDGELDVLIEEPTELPQLAPVHFLVTYDFANGIAMDESTFGITLDPSRTRARSVTDAEIVHAIAPPTVNVEGAVITVRSLPYFQRGDCDGDGRITGNVTDAIVLLGFLFLGADEPPCLAACDVNGDGEVLGSVTDAVYLLSFAFLGGAPPPPPFPGCGLGDEEDIRIGCATLPTSCLGVK